MKTKVQILAGVGTLCRAIWFSRNDSVFDKQKIYSYMQMLFRTPTLNEILNTFSKRGRSGSHERCYSGPTLNADVIIVGAVIVIIID